MNIESLQSETTQPGDDFGIYQHLEKIINADTIKSPVLLDDYAASAVLSNQSSEQRLASALYVLASLLVSDAAPILRVDKVLLDSYIAQIDQSLGEALDEILHHPEFQELESLWRGIKYVVDRTDFNANCKIDLLDVDKEVLRADLADACDITQTGLYKQVYTQEYDTPGGEPFSVMLSNFEFDCSSPDLTLLSDISKISAVTHCPFLGSVGPGFFLKDNFDQVANIADLANYFERAEYIRWNAFRETEDARYLGLTLPRFLLRLPYGDDNPVRQFHYDESVSGTDATKYLWGKAAYAFAANMSRSFKEHGWAVNIRGPESGGKVSNLLLHYYDIGKGKQAKIPSEILIPETRELAFAELGFIPLSYYKNSDFACFFSANSTQKPQSYATVEATANARINSRLPYLFLSSRLAHYLKVLQRENIGSNKSRVVLEAELNAWLQTLITKMNNPDPEIAATHPLREGHVVVEDLADNPGFFRVLLHAMPHFQVEGLDIALSLVSQMPTGNTDH